MRIIITTTLLLCILNSYGQTANARTEIKWLSDIHGKKIKKEEEKQFDNQGNLIEYIQYAGKSLICAQYQYTYDQGHLIKKSETSCSGVKRTETTYEYDQLNRVVAYVDHDIRDNADTRHVNTYSSATSNIDNTINIDNETKQAISKTSFEYYPDGLLKSEVEYVEGTWFQTITYKYDADKHLIYESVKADGGVGLIEYFYTYKRNTLVKDMVKIPGSTTEYHVYENIKSKKEVSALSSNNVR